MKNSLTTYPLRWLAAVAVISLTISAAGIADRKGHKHDPAEMAEKIVDRVDRRLDLSGEQETDLTAIVKEHVEKMREMRQSRHADIRAAWTRDSLSADDMRAALRQHRDSHRAPNDEHSDAHLALFADTMAKAHAILTPQQREQAAEMFGERGMRWLSGGGRGKGRGHGHCGGYDDHDGHGKRWRFWQRG